MAAMISGTFSVLPIGGVIVVCEWGRSGVGMGSEVHLNPCLDDIHPYISSAGSSLPSMPIIRIAEANTFGKFSDICQHPH